MRREADHGAVVGHDIESQSGVRAVKVLLSNGRELKSSNGEGRGDKH